MGLPSSRYRLILILASVVGSPRLWFCAVHDLPPSTVMLFKRPSNLSPHPPTQPDCRSTNPTPSRSTLIDLPALLTIGMRRQVSPPSVVFKIAAAVKFSSETNPVMASRNWIFQPHSPQSVPATPAALFTHVAPPSVVFRTTGFSCEYCGCLS